MLLPGERKMEGTGLARSLNSLDTELQRVVLALGIVLDRVSRLSDEDSNELIEIIKDYRNAATPEERSAADYAIMEIIGAQPIQVRRLPQPDDDAAGQQMPAKLTAWMDFVRQRIRECRKALKWTQEDLADASGLPQSHISRIETGRHSPSRTTLEKIAEALGRQLSDLDPSG